MCVYDFIRFMYIHIYVFLCSYSYICISTDLYHIYIHLFYLVLVTDDEYGRHHCIYCFLLLFVNIKTKKRFFNDFLFYFNDNKPSHVFTLLGWICFFPASCIMLYLCNKFAANILEYNKWDWHWTFAQFFFLSVEACHYCFFCFFLNLNLFFNIWCSPKIDI